jgi:hypothetical protein
VDEDSNIFTADIDDGPADGKPDDDKDPDIKVTEPDTEPAAKEPEAKPDTEPDKTEPKDDPLKAIESKYETRMADLQKEINRLGYALRKAEKAPEKKEDEPKFSRAQLLSIMQEHREDPAVMMQVFEELAKDAAKGAEISATKAADIAGKKTQMDAWLRKIDGIDDEASPVGQTVNKIIGDLYLDDHPFAKFLAASVNVNMNFDKLVAARVEEVKKELLGEKAEDVRKANIKTTAPTSPGKPSQSKEAVTLTASQLETARNLFGDDKKAIAKYARMLTRSKKSGTFQTA